MSVVISFNQDWAPAWATRELHSRLKRHDVAATFFVTHDCPSLRELRDGDLVELGWHPNFLPGSSHGSSTDEVLDTLYSWVPEAAGARAHCLIRGTPYLAAYKERGLIYDAADLHDGEPGLRALVSWTGMVRIPIWFEDDVRLQRALPLELGALDLATPGLKVFNFHPVLVALNVAELAPYEALKADLARQRIGLTDATPEHFAPHRQTARPGISDLLDQLLEWLAAHPDQQGGTLREIAEEARP